MLAKITTTITTYVDIETFEPKHEVDIDAEGGLPRQVVVAAVEGALKSTLNTLAKEEK